MASRAVSYGLLGHMRLWQINRSLDAASVITHQSGTNSEMVMAQVWARAFRLPGAKSEPAAGRDRATVFVRVRRTPGCRSTSDSEVDATKRCRLA
jgi:hypothetical protein